MKRLAVAAATMFIWVTGFAQEAPLGRLFLTPEQRAALNNARRNNIRAEAVAATPVEKKPRALRTRSVEINGLVKRSDGETIVWVNGRPINGQRAGGLRIKASPDTQGSVIVHEPGKDEEVEIKVGQRVDLRTGRVQETFDPQRQAAKTPKRKTTKPKAAKVPKVEVQLSEPVDIAPADEDEADDVELDDVDQSEQ
jgi:hypothetical protein